MRWTTPLQDHREIAGRRVPGHGEAVWHRPDGPFAYGVFDIRDVAFNQLGGPLSGGLAGTGRA
jgi:hypothetical protein